MKVITASELGKRSTEVLKDLRKERRMVITSNGKAIATLNATSDSNIDHQMKLQRQADLQDCIRRMQQSSVKAGTHRMTLKEINAVIAEVRAEGRARNGK